MLLAGLLLLTGCQNTGQVLPPEPNYEQQVFRPADFKGGQLSLTLKNLAVSETVAVIPVHAEQGKFSDGFTYTLLVDGVAPPGLVSEVLPQQHASIAAPERDLFHEHTGFLQHQLDLLKENHGSGRVESHSLSQQEAACNRPALGTLCTYWVYSKDDEQVQVTTRVRHISEHAYWFVDQQDAADLTDAELAAFARTFETRLYPTDVRYFGTPVDTDGNGKIHIVFSREVAKWGAYGYVDPADWLRDGDLFAAQETHSNEGDIFYAATPSSFLPKTSRESMLNYDLPSTLVHELKHLIVLGNRFRQGSFFEEGWIEEASAVAAEELSGYGSQMGDYARNKATRGLASPQNVRVDPGVLGDTEANDFYGYGFLFLWWLAEQQGHDHFWKALAKGPATGQQNLSQVTGRPFSDLMLDWAQVLMFSNTGISTRKNYQSLDLRESLHGKTGSSWMLLGYRPLKTLSDTARSMAYYVGRGQNRDATLTLKTPFDRPYLVVVRFKGSLPWSPANTLAGGIKVPAGESTYGLSLTACLLQEGSCTKESAKRQIKVYQDAQEATFSLTGLQAGTYLLEAFKDRNGNEIQDAGDLYGCGTGGATCAVLTPTREDLQLDVKTLP